MCRYCKYQGNHQQQRGHGEQQQDEGEGAGSGGVEAEDEAERDAEAGEGEDGVSGHEAGQRGGRDHAVQVDTLPQVLASAAAARNKPDM